MKHIKNYKELFETQTELTPEQIEWLDKCTRGKWTLNKKTGLVDVDRDFQCDKQDLTDFKGVRFGVVTGRFDCSHNRLTSLEGAPQEAGKGFDCSRNSLTSLKGAPQKVGGDFFNCACNSLTSLEGAPQEVIDGFYCSDNRLTSLEGAPRKVLSIFSCHHNSLTSLEGAPQEVGWNFDCSHNRLTSLEGAPQEVGYSFDCSHNELTSLEGAPQEVGEAFYCDNNRLTSLEGAPQSVVREFECGDNPVTEHTLRSIFKMMQIGLSFSQSLVDRWGKMKSDDKILMATHNPDLSPEEIKGYEALAKFRKKVI
jgi:hypothetical protein